MSGFRSGDADGRRQRVERWTVGGGGDGRDGISGPPGCDDGGGKGFLPTLLRLNGVTNGRTRNSSARRGFPVCLLPPKVCFRSFSAVSP